MNSKTLCKTGGVGSVVAAICCFTPALVILLPAIGLAAWLAWIDYVLWPALAIFVALTAAAFYRVRREQRLAMRRDPSNHGREGAAS